MITLVCVYLGTWHTTKTFGIKAVVEREHVTKYVARSPAPFIVNIVHSRAANGQVNPDDGYRNEGVVDEIIIRRYLWLGKLVLMKDDSWAQHNDS